MLINHKIVGSCLGIVSALSLLTGCGPALVGTGAGVVDVATQERGIKGTLNDTDIRSHIDTALAQKSTTLFSNISLAVQNGHVLLAGSVPTSQARKEAVKIAWQVKGVNAVYNEIKVGEPHSFGDGAEDVWIATKVRTKLVATEHIHSNNYSVTTFNGVVYLMGIAQSQEELDHAIQVAKSVEGVKKVISHVQIK